MHRARCTLIRLFIIWVSIVPRCARSNGQSDQALMMTGHRWRGGGCGLAYAPPLLRPARSRLSVRALWLCAYASRRPPARRDGAHRARRMYSLCAFVVASDAGRGSLAPRCPPSGFCSATARVSPRREFDASEIEGQPTLIECPNAAKAGAQES